MPATHLSAVSVGASGAGTDLSLIKVYTVAINPASIAAATSAEQTFTVNGLAVGDIPVVVKPTATAGIGIGNARVSAANTLALTFINATAGAIDPPNETYTVLAFRPGS